MELYHYSFLNNINNKDIIIQYCDLNEVFWTNGIDKWLRDLIRDLSNVTNNQ
jgi:hypothetical protein